MVLVYIFLGIFIFLLGLISVLLLSTIQIEIKNWKVGNRYKLKEQGKNSYKIKLKLYFLEKIPIFCIKLDKQKIKNIDLKKQLERVNMKEIKKKITWNKDILKAIKKFQIQIEKLSLRVEIGTEDAILTSYITAIIASVIGIVLPHVTKPNKIKDCRYIINPVYQNRNEYDINLDGIIRIKIVHIICSMLIFVKKGRNKHERTSNRRSYAYRYE